ncbi:hypothetical protein ZWY2020_045211 [Hordeum vulgare]|nr:hypothetical protein ZWY2020_045211 [Hordeum vulgare]
MAGRVRLYCNWAGGGRTGPSTSPPAKFESGKKGEGAYPPETWRTGTAAPSESAAISSSTTTSSSSLAPASAQEGYPASAQEAYPPALPSAATTSVVSSSASSKGGRRCAGGRQRRCRRRRRRRGPWWAAAAVVVALPRRWPLMPGTLEARAIEGARDAADPAG